MNLRTHPTPLLSVVIPTHSRPQFLPRAIESALQAAPDGDVEVIVVPNGGDNSWMKVAESFNAFAQVHWHPIARGHANAARNEGKRFAQGKYLWFLDDDDYLLEGATKVLELAERESLEISSAPLNLITHDEVLIKKICLAPTNDFVSSLLSPQRTTGFQYHLYLRKAISDFWFEESINIGQDTHWVHCLCRSRDWRWGRSEESACTWRQHSKSQISAAFGPHQHLKLQEQLLWETILFLNDRQRLTTERAEFSAQGMWSLIHAGYFMSPIYWYPVMNKVRNQFPGTYPDVGIYEYALGRLIHPLLMESMMLPKRWLNHYSRQKLVNLGVKSAWEF